MTRHTCARCDWTPDDNDQATPTQQLRDHAAQANHPLCRCCARSLPVQDVSVCLPCTADTRRTLQRIVELYALLPTALGTIPSSSDWRPNGPRNSDPAMPGGDALVMLGPGSKGMSQVRGVPMRDGTRDTTHIDDEHEGDAPPVAEDLASWEDLLRHDRGEPAATTPATVTTAAFYLNARLQWAADHHDEFPQLLTDLRRIVTRLETALTMGDRAEFGASCQACGVDLRRHYTDPKPCQHQRPTLVPQWSNHGRTQHLAQCQETPAETAARTARWDQAHAHCDQGGLENSWRCPSCERVYTPEEYRLAVSQEMFLKRREAHYWVPVATAARLVDRTQMTVHRWIQDDRRGIVVACDLRTRRLRVMLSTVLEAAGVKRRGRNRVA